VWLIGSTRLTRAARLGSPPSSVTSVEKQSGPHLPERLGLEPPKPGGFISGSVEQCLRHRRALKLADGLVDALKGRRRVRVKPPAETPAIDGRSLGKRGLSSITLEITSDEIGALNDDDLRTLGVRRAGDRIRGRTVSQTTAPATLLSWGLFEARGVAEAKSEARRIALDSRRADISVGRAARDRHHPGAIPFG
jgi:hypothetical protein